MTPTEPQIEPEPQEIRGLTGFGCTAAVEARIQYDMSIMARSQIRVSRQKVNVVTK